jgi:molecular chaperone GrpE
MEHTQASPQAGQPAATAQTEVEAQATGMDSVLDAVAGDAAAVGAALAEAEAKLAALQDEFLRAKAETENMRRRAADDVQKAHKFAIEQFAEHLLPVIDSLEAALAHNSEDLTKVREGMELTLRQLSNALEKGRVVAINPIGEKFDPHRHQAISMVPAEQEANTVVSVLQKGFLIADRVLRPALVTVAQSK